MITSMRGCVTHKDLWPWPISSRSLSNKTAIICHILSCLFYNTFHGLYSCVAQIQPMREQCVSCHFQIKVTWFVKTFAVRVEGILVIYLQLLCELGQMWCRYMMINFPTFLYSFMTWNTTINFKDNSRMNIISIFVQICMEIVFCMQKRYNKTRKNISSYNAFFMSSQDSVQRLWLVINIWLTIDLCRPPCMHSSLV